MKRPLISLILLSALLIPTAAFAVGAGSGGGTINTPPPATPDPDPEPQVTPQPTERQGEQEVEEPVPAPAVKATPEKAPEKETPTVRSTSQCEEDLYTCVDWGACEEDGNQRRTCTLSKECASVSTPKPEEQRLCPGLQCGHLESLQQRVSCRLDLSDTQLKEEFSVLYFPEYCKVEESDEEKQECIELYRSFKPCWQLPAGPERLSCGKEKTGVVNLQAQGDVCVAKSGDERSECAEEMEEKVEQFVLYALYELEFKAESLLTGGRAEKDQVTSLIVSIERSKESIERASEASEWKMILIAAKVRWQEFIATTTSL